MRLLAVTGIKLALFFAFLIAGCAAPTRTSLSRSIESEFWHGRLALQIEPDLPRSAAQSLSAEFELIGSPTTGELTLFTPMGSTAAALSWSPHTAIMHMNGDARHFDSLDGLIKQAVGTEIPVEALFAWLAGQNMKAAGWEADLTQHTSGRITARRMHPPSAELRLILEK